MKFKNVLIVVKDIEKSKRFYRELFGLETVLDQDGNVILTEGLVLQDEKIWKKFLGKEIVSRNNCSELYFEETDLEAFLSKLDRAQPSVRYVTKLTGNSWGRRMIRIYDPDGHLIEVSERKRT